jgi:hypothetical protein
VEDIAFQTYLLKGAGLKIGRCYMAHINRDFVKSGPIDPRRFFALEDVTERVFARMPYVEKNVNKISQTIWQSQCPEVQIGEHCSRPHQCPLIDRCWSFLPEGNVTELYRGGAKRFRLLTSDITKIADIRDHVKLTARQAIQQQTARTGKAHVDRGAIRNFVNKIQYPASFLDFESYAPAIPLHDETKPFTPVCFQFSLHVLPSPQAEPEHFGFLATGCSDPRSEFMRSLHDVLPRTGSVMAFNSIFELSRLREIVEVLPTYRGWVDNIEQRTLDLLEPFRRFHYYHPAQRGSASIKSILPALVGKSYEGLSIKNGAAASFEFLRASFGCVSPEERIQIRQDLEAYCHLDTWALVLVLTELIKWASED